MKNGKIVLFSVIIAGLLILSGCASTDLSYSSNKEAPSDGGYGFIFDDTEGDSADNSDGKSEAFTNEKIIKNANLSAETTEFDRFCDSLKTEISAIGGYIERSGVDGNGYRESGLRRAEYMIRVPAETLDDFMSKVSSLAYIASSEITTDNVTAQYIDVESHLSALRTERDTLLGLMEKAENLNDVILLQERITEVIYQIESAEGQLRSYDDKIAYSTVELRVREVQRETAAADESVWARIGTNLKNNAADIGEGLTNFFVWFVSALPYIGLILVIVGIPAVIVIACLNHSAKRKKSAAKENKE